MTNDKENYKTDEVEILVHRKSNCKIELEVKALMPLLEKAQKKALKEVKKEVSLPGFRKGKAPEDLIRKKYPNVIEEKAQKGLADIAFQDALKLIQIPVLNTNTPVTFNLDSMETDHAKFTFSYETEPEIPKVDPKEFQYKEVEKPEVGTKEIEEAVKQIRLFHAKWTPVTDRGVEENDYVIIDLETVEDNPQTIFSNTRFEVSDKSMAKWMKNLIMGKKSDAVLEGVSEPDEDIPEEEKKEFEPKRVKLTLKKIETAELPPLDDEFSKKLGAPDVEKMKEAIETMLKQKADEKVFREERDQVNAFLLETYPFDLPLSLIQAEKDHRKRQLDRDPNYKARLEAMSDEEKEEADRRLTQQSEEAVRLFYISRQIVRDNDIKVSQREVEQEAIRSMNMFGPANIDPKKIPNEMFALALSKTILAKAQNFVLEKK